MCGPHRRYAPLLPRTLRRIPQTVGTVTSSSLFSLPFSQGLEMCGPHRRFTPLLPRTLRRIPQAVSTVATYGKFICSRYKSANVSIPQAVGTVATDMIFEEPEAVSFNTASGKKHCCNTREVKPIEKAAMFQYRKR